MPIDEVTLNFSTDSLILLNVLIALMMLGMSLDLKLEDIKEVFKKPKAPAIGLIAQFLLLPAFTYLLTLILKPAPSIALGMILVASCPGGNLSNIVTWLAKGNTSVSVGMTALSSIAAIVMTPFNLSFWGRLNPATRPILQAVELSPRDVLLAIVLVLVAPMVLGMAISRFFPKAAAKMQGPFKVVSVVIFMAFVGFALSANWSTFTTYVGALALAVILHNAVALSTGYFAAKAAKLPEADVRAVSIEVGIQNSALGLTLIFTFFQGLGGMAIITALWGIWHIFSGLAIARWWARKPLAEAA